GRSGFSPPHNMACRAHLTQTASVLTQHFPEQFSQQHQEQLDSQQHLHSVITALRNLTDEGFHSTKIEIHSLLSDITTLLQEELLGQQITLKIEGEEPFPSLFLPRGPLGQTLFSLLKNSCEAITKETESGHLDADKGDITIHIQSESVETEEEPTCLIEIIDNGNGIDRDDLAQVINKGFTTKSSKIGLGLHSAANFLISIQGSIQILSDGPHQGTLAQVRLPTQRQEAE
ncbi:MAG: hypothetical protein HN421_12470, partial [Gammaproteobacteria bacterium]|nr:hypothetical protein [Gammaproteobacteria bacterium]